MTEAEPRPLERGEFSFDFPEDFQEEDRIMVEPIKSNEHPQTYVLVGPSTPDHGRPSSGVARAHSPGHERHGGQEGNAAIDIYPMYDFDGSDLDHWVYEDDQIEETAQRTPMKPAEPIPPEPAVSIPTPSQKQDVRHLIDSVRALTPGYKHRKAMNRHQQRMQAGTTQPAKPRILNTHTTTRAETSLGFNDSPAKRQGRASRLGATHSVGPKGVPKIPPSAAEQKGYWTKEYSERYRSLAMHFQSLLASKLGQPLQSSDPLHADRALQCIAVFEELVASSGPLGDVLGFFLNDFRRYMFSDTSYAYNAGASTNYSFAPYFDVVRRIEAEKLDLRAEADALEAKASKLTNEFQVRVANLEHSAQTLQLASHTTQRELMTVREQRDSIKIESKRLEMETKNAAQALIDLQYRYSQMLERHSQLKTDSDKMKSESTALRENLLNMTTQLRASMQALGEKEAECTNHVHISEVEDLRMQVPELHGQLNKQRKALAQLQTKIKTRDQKIDELGQDYEHAINELTTLTERQSHMTPRPNWFEAVQYVPSIVLEDASSQQLLEDTFAEIERLKHELESMKAEGGSRPVYGQPSLQQLEEQQSMKELKPFIGKGVGSHVPKYLRAGGRVKHRFIKKRDCERMVKDIWEQKSHYDKNPLVAQGKEGTDSNAGSDTESMKERSPSFRKDDEGSSERAPDAMAEWEQNKDGFVAQQLLGAGRQSRRLSLTGSLTPLPRRGSQSPLVAPRKGGRTSSFERPSLVRQRSEKNLKAMKKTKDKKKDKEAKEEEDKKRSSTAGKLSQLEQDDVESQMFADDIQYECSLEDFLYLYLQKKHGSHQTVVEYGYSLLAALRRYDYDADCELFLKILTGELAESVYYDQMIMLERLLVEMRQLAEKKGDDSTSVTKKDLIKLLQGFFYSKSNDNFRRLVRALNINNPGNSVEYETLFAEDQDGNQGEFIECVRDQHVTEIIEYSADLETAMRERATEVEDPERKDTPSRRKRGEQRTQMILLGDAKAGLLEVDPRKPMDMVFRMLARGAGVPRAHLDLSASMNVEEFLDNLRQGLVKRFSFPADSPNRPVSATRPLSPASRVKKSAGRRSTAPPTAKRTATQATLLS